MIVVFDQGVSGPGHFDDCFISPRRRFISNDIVNSLIQWRHIRIAASGKKHETLAFLGDVLAVFHHFFFLSNLKTVVVETSFYSDYPAFPRSALRHDSLRRLLKWDALYTSRGEDATATRARLVICNPIGLLQCQLQGD